MQPLFELFSDRLSALPAVSSVADGDSLYVVQSGAGKRATRTQLLTGATLSGTTTLASMTAGSVLFAGAGGVVSQDNGKLFWDDANNRLGIGTSSPTNPLHVVAAGNLVNIENVTSGVNAGLLLTNSASGGRTYGITSQSTGGGYGAGTLTIYDVTGGNTSRLTINSSGNVGIGETSPGAKLQVNTGASGTIGQIIKAAPSQSANLQEWQDSAGTVLLAVNASGYFGNPNGNIGFITSAGTAGLFNADRNRLIVYGEALGGGMGSSSVTITAGKNLGGGGYNYPGIQLTNGLNNTNIGAGTLSTLHTASGEMVRFNFNSATTGFFFAPYEGTLRFRGSVGNGIIADTNPLTITPSAASVRPLVVKGAPSQSANLQEWQDSAGTVYGTISENGYWTTRKNSAPADAELAAGELALWFDSTNGASKLKIKAKSADGTVVTGEVALA